MATQVQKAGKRFSHDYSIQKTGLTKNIVTDV